jgi:signal transduction histidine kinase
VLLVAAVLLAAVFVWQRSDPDPGSGIAFLYVAPIALLAVRFGLRAGLGGVAVATVLWTAYALDAGAGLVEHLTRIVGFLVVGGTLGWHSDQARRVERQRAQDGAALVAANRRLADAMAASAAANAELGAINDDLRQFMHVASHDLAEPLRTMGGFATLVATRCAGQIDETGQQHLRHVVDGAARMQRLLDDLSTYTRATQQQLEPERVDLGRVVEGVRTALGASIRERGAVVVVDGTLPAVDGDGSMLGLVFQNLISNALKFNTAREPTVRVSATRDGTRVVVDVADNGIGLPVEHADRIFDLFQRLHPRDAYPGTGLGLAICRRVVERHGGTLELATSSPRGSTFRLRLPAAGDVAVPA